jgi:hypothetical protein
MDKLALKNEMLRAIFVKTGGRPENVEIAEICAEIALKQYFSNSPSFSRSPSFASERKGYYCAVCGNNEFWDDEEIIKD